MHYYQFNIGDYASHTRGLSLYEDLAYRRLLDVYYLQERPLNSGIASVARQIGMADYVEAVKFVLECHFSLTEDGWINTRADKEIKSFHSKIEQASRAGKASAERRSNKRPTTVQPTNNQEPITNNHITPKPPKGADVRFEKFWAAYPKKVGKFDAKRAFDKRKVDDQLLESMLSAVMRQSGTDAWRKDGGQFIPNPSTWLNQGRWQDEGVSFLSTPSEPKGRDPALLKIDEDSKKTSAPPPEILAKMKALRKIV
jgi:uncharacterized protein YdaU (DUF1376 family)